jgi:hypothetical protein
LSAINGGEGRLQIRVTVENRVIVNAALTSTRPVNACSLLVGRRLDDAMTLLPRLFSVCSTAQAVAGLIAAEAALGFTPAPAQVAARRLLVAAEALDQTVWRILLDWPRCVGAAPALESLKRLRRRLASLRPLLFPDPAWNRIGGARLTPNHVELAVALGEIESGVNEAVLGGEQWDDRRSFERWLRAAMTPAAMTLRFVSDGNLASFGCCAVMPLSEFDADAIGETGALARLWLHPLVTVLRADYGNGILTRLTARVLETSVLVTELRDQTPAINTDPGMMLAEAASGMGLGRVECARGRLIHRLVVVEGRVRDYHILAPTEWNFHPQGCLVRGLVGASMTPGATVRQVIELLITALDPCVGFDLVIEAR